MKKNIFTYSHSFQWKHRVIVRVLCSGLFILMLMILARGWPEIVKDPSSFLFIWGIYVVFNLFQVPSERKKVKKISIKKENVTITQFNNKETQFMLSDISKVERIDRKHGFRGYLVEQLLIKVKGKGDFAVSANIKNFKCLCEQFSVIDIDKLDTHVPE
ncbi:MAG: hypothetical protein GY920_02895 [Aliivibrio sp.]|nr:hypothetical protein [Aliivibrio sp.]